MYLRQDLGTKKTPQSEVIPGSSQEKDSAGGYAWPVDDWQRLDRFLILGTEGGTYYIGERELTKEKAGAVLRCVKADGLRVVRRLVEMSYSGLAPKNDPALFTLAMCAAEGDVATRKEALDSLPKVARIGTHLFHFIAYAEQFRGWGRGLRTAIKDWYLSWSLVDLAYQMVKYQQRDRWSHRDMLRLSHPKTAEVERNALFHWVTQGEAGNLVPHIIKGFEKLQLAESASVAARLITEFNLPMEAVPTKFKQSPGVWEVLLPNLPFTALLRNLGNLSKAEVLAQGKWDRTLLVTERLTNTEAIKAARIHPIGVLAALTTYSQGHGGRGKGKWNVVPEVVDALDKAFYLAFSNVKPTGKRIILALDVSGSMSGGKIAGVFGLTPRVGAAAMAMVTFKTEQSVAIVAFQEKITPLDISRCSHLKDVVETTEELSFGGTDCAQPMLWALENKVEADAFIVYTDSETWAGKIHPAQALAEYRRRTGIPAKLVVVGMVANKFSIADPSDRGMLDVVGFSADAPPVISNFLRE